MEILYTTATTFAIEQILYIKAMAIEYVIISRDFGGFRIVLGVRIYSQREVF